MIIKGHRIATGASKKRLLDHLFRGAENDEVIVLLGGELDILDAWRDAQGHGAARALRSWIIAPHETTSREQAMHAVAALAAEFGFEPTRATVIEHAKARVTPDAFDRHWHVVVGEVDPVSGRVLSSRHDRPRHEFVARALEAEFGHAFVLGAHTIAVLARLRREGRSDLADRLNAALRPSEAELPREAFTTVDHRSAKRRGVDLAAVREAVAVAWQSTTTVAALTETLARDGLALSRGNAPGEWIIERDGAFLGSLYRLLKAKFVITHPLFVARKWPLAPVRDV